MTARERLDEVRLMVRARRERRALWAEAAMRQDGPAVQDHRRVMRAQEDMILTYLEQMEQNGTLALAVQAMPAGVTNG
ncbi:hypothetical protein [Nioella sp.]|uniref:hypothetical protein n=1 Tax=Nioella sp. TaxID=1912091 RepID=UPI0035150714